MRQLGTGLGLASLTRCLLVASAVGQSQKPGSQPATAKQVARQATTADQGRARRMDELLSRWERISSSNETLYAKFEREDKISGFPDPKVFIGQALFHKPNLACMDTSEVVNDKPNPVFQERIVCSGDKVYQIQGATKQVNVYHFPEDERRRALEEGPLPFLFNMRMAQAKARYSWNLLREEQAADGKPPECYIEIVPLHEIDKQEFSRAHVRLNLETFLPVALRLFATNGKDTQTYAFKEVERNGPRNAAGNLDNYNGARWAELFRAKGYKIVVNPAADPAPAQLGTRPAGTQSKPATRPAQNAPRR